MINIADTDKYFDDPMGKKYPKAGSRWEKDEDEKLKELYEEFKKATNGDFDNFISEITQLFGRAPGGIKGRLAKYYEGIPGWDYEKDAKRQEIASAEVSKFFNQELDTLLKNEYETYVLGRTETYLAFLKRVSLLLGGIKGSITGFRLAQLVQAPQKFTRSDVGMKRPVMADIEKEEEQGFDFAQNLQASKALKLMEETKNNVFLTGEAGTGKSTLLKYFRLTTKKNVVVLAPTGVAALNVEGQTIHSFCGFGPDITLSKVKRLIPSSPKRKLLEKLDMVVIDEISMVRADLLDCLDKFLRQNGPTGTEPFGGLQMVFIGDLYQLPPVEKDFVNTGGLFQEYRSPYFFDSHSFENSRFENVRLETVYRQKEALFLEVLNAVRNNTVSREHLTILNQRVQDGENNFTFEKFAVYLTTTNFRAKQINNYFLERISSPAKNFAGITSGNFVDREPPTEVNLTVKVGAQIMMLNNDRKKRWVNGTMGKIVGFGQAEDREMDERESDPLSYWADEDAGVPMFGARQPQRKAKTDGEEYFSGDQAVTVELETGEIVKVFPYTWEMYKFELDKRTQKVESRVSGTFTQYPFRLAWAVTIHKAQGKTFDKVYIDLSTGTFAHGQLYVALSRCRTLQGLYLKRPIGKEDVILDRRVVEFLNTFFNKAGSWEV